MYDTSHQPKKKPGGATKTQKEGGGHLQVPVAPTPLPVACWLASSNSPSSGITCGVLLGHEGFGRGDGCWSG